MEEQLISFETAKLAKEKGFDFKSSKCWVKLLSGEIVHNDDRQDVLEHDRCKYYLSQPTQSLLQKWLREEQNLIVVCSPIITFQQGWEDEIMFKGLIYTYEGIITACNGDDYESSLEISLQEALKLI